MKIQKDNIVETRHCLVSTDNKWFTLVELIVVITIIAILSTIGFVSYSGYLAWVRDTIPKRNWFPTISFFTNTKVYRISIMLE